MKNTGKVSWVFFSFITASLLLIGALVVLVIEAFLKVPDFTELRSAVEITIKKANGEPGKKMVGPKAPGWVPTKAVSKNVYMAIISSEDASFYSHTGVDYHELKEAIKKDIEEKKWARGASTLTQQVIKNTFLSQEKTIWRKIREILWAGKLEKVLSKSEILTFYVNMVELGPGIYGIGTAAPLYFGVAPSALTPKQAAFIALLLPSPRKYYSYYQKRQLTKWANQRINQILRVMNRMGFLSDEEFERARSESLWGEAPLLGDPDSVPTGDEDKEIPDEPSVVPSKMKAKPEVRPESDTFEAPAVPAAPEEVPAEPPVTIEDN